MEEDLYNNCLGGMHHIPRDGETISGIDGWLSCLRETGFGSQWWCQAQLRFMMMHEQWIRYDGR